MFKEPRVETQLGEREYQDKIQEASLDEIFSLCVFRVNTYEILYMGFLQ